jgi:hypothetical protein
MTYGEQKERRQKVDAEKGRRAQERWSPQEGGRPQGPPEVVA